MLTKKEYYELLGSSISVILAISVLAVLAGVVNIVDVIKLGGVTIAVSTFVVIVAIGGARIGRCVMRQVDKIRGEQ